MGRLRSQAVVSPLSVIISLLVLLVENVFSVKLAPINNLEDLATPQTHTKREVSFTGDLDLQDLETFVWAAPAGKNLIYANLTVYFPEEYRYIVAMERFAGKLRSVECTEDMMLEFTDNAAFEYAKNVWNWVNQDVNNSFIMVTNYEGCADDMERLPFVVSNIRYDEAQNKAHLTADLKEWEEIAHSYTLNIGHTPLNPAHNMLKERGLMSRGPDFSMDLTSGYDKNLFSTTMGGWTTSVDAVVRTVGSLDVDFDLDVDWFKLKSASMTITPEDVAASIQLALSESGTLAQAYNWQKTIISIPIEGIEIAKVVKLGAFLDVDVGFTMEEWSGSAQANLGARMEISNDAIVKIDLVKSSNNKFSGWTPTFTPIPLTLSAKVEGSAKVFAEPNVKLEASALGKGWNVGLNLQMPYIQADFAAMLESTGVCDTKKTIGVDIDARIGVLLAAQAATKGNEANPFWEQELYSNEWELISKCLAFGPENAHSGEAADPNPPASKTKKPKTTTKATKTKTKTKTSKKPKSTKPSKTTALSETANPEPTKTHSSKKTKTKGPSPTKVVTRKTKTPSAAGDPTRLKKPTSSSVLTHEASTTSKPKESGRTSTTTAVTTWPGTESASKTGPTSEPFNKWDATLPTSGTKTNEASGTGDPTLSTTTKYTSEPTKGICDATLATPCTPSSGWSTLSVSSTSFSTFSWSNSTHARTRTKQSRADLPATTSVEGSSSDTSTPLPFTGDSEIPGATSTADEKPSASPRGSDVSGLPFPSNNNPSESSAGGSTPSGPGPDGRTTSPAVSTPSVSLPPPSSSSFPDACDINNRSCTTCADSLDMDAATREYFSLETDNVPAPASNTTYGLLKRATRHYKYVCSNLTFPISMAEYPTYATLRARPSAISISDFYQAANPTNCLDHRITTTTAGAAATPVFAAEHVYEGNWILAFLRALHNEDNISCADMSSLFFTPTMTNNAGQNWAQALMESLGSEANQDLLVFLRQNINGAKFRIFMPGNDIIATHKFRAAGTKGKLEKMAVVGRALDYLAQPHVGAVMQATAEQVEATLDALVEVLEPAAKQKLGGLAGEGKLKARHRAWLNGFLGSRNAVATKSMRIWASEASRAYVQEVGVTATDGSSTMAVTATDGSSTMADPTVRFLEALQTSPPKGFDTAKYAPLL